MLKVDVTTATVTSGETPVVFDWDYLNSAHRDANPRTGRSSILPGTGYAGYYNQAINKDAPHPAAARLWQEFLYSDEVQNLWLKGGARPVRMEAMIEAGTIDQALADALPAAPDETVVPTEQQCDRRRHPARRELGRSGQLAMTLLAPIDTRTGATDAGADATTRPPRRSGAAGVPAALGLVPFALYLLLFLALPTVFAIGSGFAGDDGFTLDNVAALADPVIVARSSTPSGSRRSPPSSVPSSARSPATRCSTSARAAMVRSLVEAASGVLAQFGGVMLAFAFIATIGLQGLVTLWLQDVYGIDIFAEGAWIYGLPGLILPYIYFQVPLMIITFIPAMNGVEAAVGRGEPHARRQLASRVLAAHRCAGAGALVPRQPAAALRERLLVVRDGRRAREPGLADRAAADPCGAHERDRARPREPRRRARARHDRRHGRHHGAVRARRAPCREVATMNGARGIGPSRVIRSIIGVVLIGIFLIPIVSMAEYTLRRRRRSFVRALARPRRPGEPGAVPRRSGRVSSTPSCSPS